MLFKEVLKYSCIHELFMCSMKMILVPWTLAKLLNWAGFRDEHEHSVAAVKDDSPSTVTLLSASPRHSPWVAASELLRAHWPPCTYRQGSRSALQ